MNRFASRSCLFFVLVVGLTLGQPGHLEAARFSLNPTRVFLSARTTSAVFAVTNDSSEPLRLQLSMFAWRQEPDGEMTLQPTEDLLFFPQLLTVAAGEERRIRVAATVPSGPVEQAYRIVLEELPPSSTPPDAAGTVRVLTKMSLPVFITPAAPLDRGELRDVEYRPDSLSFSIANTGNVHFVPEGLVVKVLAADAQVLGEQGVDAWYVLAGTSRRFRVDTRGLALNGASALLVEGRVGGTTLRQRLELR